MSKVTTVLYRSVSKRYHKMMSSHKLLLFIRQNDKTGIDKVTDLSRPTIVRKKTDFSNYKDTTTKNTIYSVFYFKFIKCYHRSTNKDI